MEGSPETRAILDALHATRASGAPPRWPPASVARGRCRALLLPPTELAAAAATPAGSAAAAACEPLTPCPPAHLPAHLPAARERQSAMERSIREEARRLRQGQGGEGGGGGGAAAAGRKALDLDSLSFVQGAHFNSSKQCTLPQVGAGLGWAGVCGGHAAVVEPGPAGGRASGVMLRRPWLEALALATQLAAACAAHPTTHPRRAPTARCTRGTRRCTCPPSSPSPLPTVRRGVLRAGPHGAVLAGAACLHRQPPALTKASSHPRHPPPAGEALVEISALPDWAQPGFKGMKSLNRIQSRVCDCALYSSEVGAGWPLRSLPPAAAAAAAAAEAERGARCGPRCCRGWLRLFGALSPMLSITHPPAHHATPSGPRRTCWCAPPREQARPTWPC